MKILLKLFNYLTIQKSNIPFLLFLYSIIIINEVFLGIYSGDLPELFILSEFFPAYVLVLIKQLLSSNRILTRCYNVLLFAWILFFFLVDFYCVHAMNGLFNSSLAFIMLGSNPNETFEFLSLFYSQFFSFKGFITISTILILLIAYKVVEHKKIVYPTFIQFLLSAIALFSLAVTWNYEISSRTNAKGFLPPNTTNLFTKTSVFFKLKPAPDLHKFYSSPQLVYDKDRLPQNLVVIIGESFSKSHSSLYGYNKETNPLLQKLKDEHSLVVFDSVTAPATQTVPAFKYFMSEYNRKNKDDIEWFKCLTIPEVFQILGYTTHWISNQRTKGFNDNICTKYAELCDSCYFLRNEDSYFLTPNSQDEVLLTQLDKILSDDKEKHMYFLHLMGSHPSYKERYPESFERFSPSDYLQYPEHQRENLAAYDNSIVYNDSVVYEIMDRFANQESVVVYFSDHGQDIYESDPSYTGHAKNTPNSAKYGMQIPFMVYFSTKYQEDNESSVRRATKNVYKEFSTENLIYTLMDIVNAEFKENNKVEMYSLLRKENMLSNI